MTTIQQLFDQSRNIYRPIEKVITYKADQTERLKAEISEYVVTDNIENQFYKLLSDMELAMDAGGEYEIGVWVSGFYGSGKSSFTKYLGFAFDTQREVDGIPFHQHLQNRFRDARTKALMGALVKKFPAAVVLLDLASEMLTGATQEPVSNVLYYKVLQWAGYSQNLKVAAFERKLRKDGHYDAFCQKITEATGMAWREVQNDPLVVDSLVPGLAHEFYPALFKTPASFDTDIRDIKVFENQRVQEMLDIVRETSGKEYVIFIIDEAGQYVGPRDLLILNLQGLAENLKNLGRGKAWIMGTAQQRLTEDDTRAALNSPYLFKLKDRFPISIDLEPKDIKEIATKRLLGKSPEGERLLGQIFDQHGQRLRHHTKLQDAKYFDVDFNRETFVNLYPFLPAHFDILLQLLSALAKSTGGYGLRSAIKVIQEILIESNETHPPVAEEPLGWLATTATLYDALEKDIARAFPSLHSAVGKVSIRFPNAALHQGIAKTVAILQILNNLPATEHNVAGLLHPGVEADSQLAAGQAALREMLADTHVPLGEQDGQLRFFSEKLNDIELEMAQMGLISAETRRIFNESLRDALSPLPTARLHETLAIGAGLRVWNGGQNINLAGDRETIQFVVSLADPTDYENQRLRLLEESRQPSNRHQIFLLGRSNPAADGLVAEIFRCDEINRKYKNDSDQEVREYCIARMQRAAKLRLELQRLLLNGLAGGSFLFHGQNNAVESLNPLVSEACRKQLADAAHEVFDRYAEAPLRASTSLAEEFLRLNNLNAVTTKTDPLGLVKVEGGQPRIHRDHKALQSIRDYLDRSGNTEGRVLSDHFTEAPFSWSPDTLRYLLAVMLVGGEIKLRVGGRDVTANGQQALDALKTNNTFKSVGVGLRMERPSMEVLATAAQRLTGLLGETVLPLEAEISKMAVKYLPQLQGQLAPLGERLSALQLPGKERVEGLVRDLSELLAADASDAPQRFGAPDSNLFNAMQWAKEVQNALQKGLEPAIRALRDCTTALNQLPDSGIPAELRYQVADTVRQVQEHLDQTSFYQKGPDLNTALTELQARVRDAVLRLKAEQQGLLRAAEEDLRRLPEWSELTQEEQANLLAQLETFSAAATDDLNGLQILVRQGYNLGHLLGKLKTNIEETGRQRRMERLEQEKEKARQQGQTKLHRTVKVPAALQNAQQLDQLIAELQNLRHDLELHHDIVVNIEII